MEIDPNHYNMCRLCLDNLGIYRINHSVQLKIKFCYDIQVDTFDCLSKLICRTCKPTLIKYSNKKNYYLNKQKILRQKWENKSMASTSVPEPEQDSVSSIQQFTNKESDKKDNNEVIICDVPSIKFPDTRKSLISEGKNKKVNKHIKKRLPDSWATKYNKWFMCRFCNKCCKTRCGVVKHINTHSSLMVKYLSFIDKHCSVKLKKTDHKPNLCNSERIVVHDFDKLIRSDDKFYYILYKQKRVLNVNNDEVNSLIETLSVSNTDKNPESGVSEPVFKQRKSKRLRLISDETGIFENDYDKCSSKFDIKTCKVNKLINDSEKINLDDFSDTAPCKRVSYTNNNLNKDSHCKIIQNIVCVCFNKFAKMLEIIETDDEKIDSSLKHQVLSFGRKIINNSGINCIGILRYLEHQILDVVWKPRFLTKSNKKLYNVEVMIKLRILEENDAPDGWTMLQNLKNILVNTQPLKETSNEPLKTNEKMGEPFTNMLDKNKSKERNVSVSSGQAKLTTVNNIISEKDLILKKLLNANPVKNPKQLRKKTNVQEIQCVSIVTKAKETDKPVETPAHSVLPNEEFSESSDQYLLMPIITSTMSLAPVTMANGINIQENINNKNVPLLLNNTIDCNSDANAIDDNITNERGCISDVNETQVSDQNAQWMKIKPITELMSDRALNKMHQKTEQGSNKAINQTLSMNLPYQNSSNVVYTANVGRPQLHSVADTSQLPKPVETLPILENNTSEKIINSNREFVLMDTVDLPRRKTDLPFTYFKILLQLHGMILLDTNATLSCDFHNLVKLKMFFSEDANLPVVLNLGLYCSLKPPESAAQFCIKLRDLFNNDIDIYELSTNWQWEILKVFTGDEMVRKMLMNALKISPIVHGYTKIFVRLLKDIKFQKL